MNTPWVELSEYQDQENWAGPGFVEFIWQALFACQVDVPSFEEWVKLKWGFNALALFEENLERQRLFLESQYAIRRDLGVEAPDHRTLAFRFINRPGQGLLVAILGKIHARTKAEAMESALAYYAELKSILPYDYLLIPAVSRTEFLRISGHDILEGNNAEADFAQLKRLEAPLQPERHSLFLQGLWKSGPHAHELIWRLLASSSSPLVLNISLRSTVLYANERERLLKSMEDNQEEQDPSFHQKLLSSLKKWSHDYVERRLVPWRKFFYLQIHLASLQKLSQNVLRVIGNSLTLSDGGTSQPGYQVICPRYEEGQMWRKKLKNLDLIFSGSYLPLPRLSEVADLDEVIAVMRLPYSPPEQGFPDVSFITSRNT